MTKQNETLKKENEALKEEMQAQKMKIAALSIELEKAGAATGMEERLGSGSDGNEVGANPRNLDSKVGETEKLQKRCD